MPIRRKKLLYYVVFLIVIILYIGTIYKIRPTFTLINESLVSKDADKDMVFDITYLQVVSCSGYITENAAQNYMDNIIPPEEATGIVVRFYRAKKENAFTRENLIYEYGSRID